MLHFKGRKVYIDRLKSLLPTLWEYTTKILTKLNFLEENIDQGNNDWFELLALELSNGLSDKSRLLRRNRFCST